MEEELPVLFHVPTLGRDEECLLFSLFHVPVRLILDSGSLEGLSEWERLTSCFLRPLPSPFSEDAWLCGDLFRHPLAWYGRDKDMSGREGLETGV